MSEHRNIILVGLFTGITAVFLVWAGNPANMGFCIACFLRDMAGAMGWHRAEVVQYMRPEIIGLVLGASVVSMGFREFRPTGGSGTALRFFLGAAMMMGALVFLGCPWRLLLRLAGGDLNALVALPGYLLGIWVGVQFLSRGYTLGRSTPQTQPAGLVGPALILGALGLLLLAPGLLFFSAEGPGSQYAPWLISLGAGLIVGGLAQRSRLCTMGAFRDVILFRDFHLFSGVAAVFAAALVGNILMGSFQLSFIDQPVAHSDGLMNFLAMGVVGLGAVLAGGCPLRQLILMAQGDNDATVTVLGMLVGAAVMHNFGWAGSPDGVSSGAVVMVIVLWLLLLGIAAGVIYRGVPALAGGREPGLGTGVKPVN